MSPPPAPCILLVFFFLCYLFSLILSLPSIHSPQQIEFSSGFHCPLSNLCYFNPLFCTKKNSACVKSRRKEKDAEFIGQGRIAQILSMEIPSVDQANFFLTETAKIG